LARIAHAAERGLIAIAITLLLRNIDLPIASGALAARQADIVALLAGRADQLLTFLVSFVILAYGWMGHSRPGTSITCCSRCWCPCRPN
jgi:uncharacterized membrane protein